MEFLLSEFSYFSTEKIDDESIVVVTSELGVNLQSRHFESVASRKYLENTRRSTKSRAFDTNWRVEIILQGPNELNEKLLKEINERGQVYMVPSKVKGTFFLRMAICSRYTQIEDIDVTWNEVKSAGQIVLSRQ